MDTNPVQSIIDEFFSPESRDKCIAAAERHSFGNLIDLFLFDEAIDFISIVNRSYKLEDVGCIFVNDAVTLSKNMPELIRIMKILIAGECIILANPKEQPVGVMFSQVGRKRMTRAIRVDPFILCQLEPE